MDWKDPAWKDFTDDVPADGELILGLFDTVAIECHSELDGFYTRDDRLLTDRQGYPATPDKWLPTNNHNDQV